MSIAYTNCLVIKNENKFKLDIDNIGICFARIG